MPTELGPPTPTEPTAIARRLRAKEQEIDDAIFGQVRASVPDSVGDDASYESGLYRAIVEGVDYCISIIEAGVGSAVSLPTAVVEQGRRAARHGVGIETVVHRIALAERIVTTFATTEVGELPATDLNRILGLLGPAVDSLIAALAEAHRLERGRLEEGSDGRRASAIERLLSGGPATVEDQDALGYPLIGWHLGMVGAGKGVEESMRHLAGGLGLHLLLYTHDPQGISGWLGGGHRRVDFADITHQAAVRDSGVDARIVVGEPGEGHSGWRRTHEQARLALLPGSRRAQQITRAADVLFEAALSKDKATARLLVATYLLPLANLRRSGELALETLRTYFAHDRNISSTASALNVARGTIEHRLKEVEGAIGVRLTHEQMTRLEMALGLSDELDGQMAGPRRGPFGRS